VGEDAEGEVGEEEEGYVGDAGDGAGVETGILVFYVRRSEAVLANLLCSVVMDVVGRSGLVGRLARTELDEVMLDFESG
jgi:hypothetical protein